MLYAMLSIGVKVKVNFATNFSTYQYSLTMHNYCLRGGSLFMPQVGTEEEGLFV